MKILALGGCGQEGKNAVRDMVNSDDVKQIVIGDINMEAADAFKSELASSKVSTLQLDVTDREKLTAAMREADVVANFVGPYYKFGLLTLSAAIEAGTPYIDICDDYDTTADLLALDEEAREKGVTAIIGLGASPGLGNLCALHGANRLDQAEEVRLQFVVPVTDVENADTSATMDHVMHMIDGNIPQYIGGELVDVPAAGGIENANFPVFGETPVCDVGHPEPVTLPRYIKGLKKVTCKGSILGADPVLHAMSALGLTSTVPIEIKGQQVVPRDMGIALLGLLPEDEEAASLTPISCLKVLVSGTKDGAPAEYTYTVAGKMGPMTGIPLSIGAVMLGRGEIMAKGVYAPEGVIDPDKFFAETAKRGVVVEID